MREDSWRVGRHYGIHVYEGNRPVATFHREEDAAAAVDAVNRLRPRVRPPTAKEAHKILDWARREHPEWFADG